MHIKNFNQAWSETTSSDMTGHRVRNVRREQNPVLNFTLLKRYHVKSTLSLVGDLLSTQHNSKHSKHSISTTENNLIRKMSVKAANQYAAHKHPNMDNKQLRMVKMHCRQQSHAALQQIRTTLSFRSSLPTFHLLPDPLPLSLQPQEVRPAHRTVQQPKRGSWSAVVNMSKHSCVTPLGCHPLGSPEAHSRSQHEHYCKAQDDSTLRLRNQCTQSPHAESSYNQSNSLNCH